MYTHGTRKDTSWGTKYFNGSNILTILANILAEVYERVF